MSRRRHYLLQGRTFYVLQKGSPKDLFFIDEACFSYYLNRLLSGMKAFRLQLHTYVLLPHEVHLLVSPFSADGLVLLLEKVANDYGAYFCNRFEDSCPLLSYEPVLRRVARGDQVLNFQKSIELIPVREQIVNMPGEYPWSGYRFNAFGGHKDPIFMHHQYRIYCSESGRPFQRYRDFVATTSSAGNSRPEL